MTGNVNTAEALAQLKAMEAKLLGGTGGGDGFAAGGAPQAVVAAGQPSGMLVPVTLKTPAGEVTVQVAFGPEACVNPDQFVLGLINKGWPVKAYQPRQEFGGGGGGGGFGGGGGYRGGNGGGYRRGGY